MSVATQTSIVLHEISTAPKRFDAWEAFVAREIPWPLSLDPSWPLVLAEGLGHVPYWIEAVEERAVRGILPLAFVRSSLFGRFLVSLPYLNVGGVIAVDDTTAAALIDRAIKLADSLKVRHLELRHERPIEHPALTAPTGHKVHMRLRLPDSPEELWQSLDAKVRNQIRKARKIGLTTSWGGSELLDAFHDVFSRNMRDLGTPVYGRSLFQAILNRFPDRAELCVVRLEDRPVAASLLMHGRGVTEVPSASSLRAYNSTCANMLMYSMLLERAIQRGQNTFDFGRSTPDGPTYRFKKQWGAAPALAAWQRYERMTQNADPRPDDPRFRSLVRIWQHLPLGLTRLTGPYIVRGIP